MTIAEKLQTIAENEPKVYDAGYAKGKAEGGGSLDLSLYFATLQGVFANAVFNDGTDLILNCQTLTVDNLTGAFSSMKGVKNLVLKAPLLVGKTVAMTTTFTSSTVEVIDFTQAPFLFGFTASTFMHCTALREIKGELDFTNATFNGYEFYNCTSLERVTLKAGSVNKSISFVSCNGLDSVSVQSIIDGLADLTGQTA